MKDFGHHSKDQDPDMNVDRKGQGNKLSDGDSTGNYTRYYILGKLLFIFFPYPENLRSLSIRVIH